MADLKISALTASTTPLAGTEVLPIVQSSTTVKVAVSDLTAGRAVSTAALTATGLITAPKGSSAGVTIGDVTTNSNSVLRLQGTSAGYNWQIANNLNSGGIEFTQSTATGGTTYTTPKFEMLNTGNFNIAAGNVVIGTSGKGIDFSATPGTGTSELLADYEEGTFTPTYYGSSSAGATTYTSQTGYYTKIGRIVYFTLRVDWSSATGTGFPRVGGLPFSAINLYQAMTIYGDNYGLTALNIIAARAGYGTVIEIMQQPTGGGALADAPMDGAASLVITGFYQV
jgi:hypothetical protein